MWDGETSKWWLCAADVVAAVVDTNNPRIYWATLTVDAVDSDSGLADIPYSFDNGRTWQSEPNKTYSKNTSISSGAIKVKIFAKKHSCSFRT